MAKWATDGIWGSIAAAQLLLAVASQPHGARSRAASPHGAGTMMMWSLEDTHEAS